MDHNQTYEEHSKCIILNDLDNIIIALDNKSPGHTATSPQPIGTLISTA